MVVHTFNPSYMEGIGRKILIQDQAKVKPYLKK
jgi:hypothetical protein